MVRGEVPARQSCRWRSAGKGYRAKMRMHDEPNRDWKNIFQLWRENGERLLFIVARNSWEVASGSYLVVERIEIKKWPYGSAWGRYHYYGKPSGPQEKIKVVGTYAWMFLMPDDPAHPKE